ncbi:MAG: SusD/RagB family nutrient-binding outer membrane lipoprotein [Bacteroidota bacterium]
MKNIFILTVIFSLVVFSCEETLEEINVNTNNPSEVNPGVLLPSAIVEPADEFVNVFDWMTDNLMQYSSGAFGVGNEVGRYDFNLEILTDIDPWNIIYSSFSDLNDIEQSAVQIDQPAYQAAAKILRSVYAAGLSELFTNVPYFEAGKGAEGITQPVYDSQEAIYLNIIDELKMANSLLDESAAFTLGGDVLYNGDVIKWKKLANSLRLRYLLRISNITSVNAAQEINQIFSSPETYPIFESNDDQGVYDFTGEFPNITDVANGRLPEFSYLSEFFVMTFSIFNDPRLDFFGSLPTNPNINEHVGLPAGLSEEEASSYNGDVTENVSRVTLRFQAEDQGLYDYAFMTYAELQFILAEAALEGWITSDPQFHYEAGIQANFDYWRIDLPTDYFTRQGVAWQNDLEQIMNQKWLASYKLNTVEIWAEYKRTGLPNLSAGPNAVINTVPTRIRYPLIEQSVNPSSYQSAISAIGGDILDVSLWYQ